MEAVPFAVRALLASTQDPSLHPCCLCPCSPGPQVSCQKALTELKGLGPLIPLEQTLKEMGEVGCLLL